LLAINTDITDKKHLETQFLRANGGGTGMLAGGIARVEQYPDANLMASGV